MLESFLLLTYQSLPLARVLIFIHQFQIVARPIVLEYPGSVDVLALNQHELHESAFQIYVDLVIILTP